MFRVLDQQHEISDKLPPEVQATIRRFHTRGVDTFKKVAFFRDEQSGAVSVAAVYSVLYTPLPATDVGVHVKWLYIYSTDTSWVYIDQAGSTSRQLALQETVLREIFREETENVLRQASYIALCPYVRFLVIDDKRVPPQAVVWPARVDQLIQMHKRVVESVAPVAKTTPVSGIVQLHNLGATTKMGASAAPSGAFPLEKSPADAPVPMVPGASISESLHQHNRYLAGMAPPYAEAASKGNMICACVCLRITAVHQKKHAGRPVMFAAHVSLSAADPTMRPIPSLYVHATVGALAWCIVPLRLPLPHSAMIHFDAYQEMNNASRTRVTHCRVAHAHFDLGILYTSNRSFQQVFTHVVDHERVMTVTVLRDHTAVSKTTVLRDHTAVSKMFGSTAIPRFSQAEVVTRLPLASIQHATRDYINRLHDRIDENGGVVAKFPSGAYARNTVEQAFTTEGPIPIVSYFNMSVGARILSEQSMDPKSSCAFINNLCNMACVLMGKTVAQARELVTAAESHPVFCMNLLATYVRVLASCLAHSADQNGEDNTLPWSVPDFAGQQVDCEELAVLCGMSFHQLCRLSELCDATSLARLLYEKVGVHYDPMLCLVTTSTDNGTSVKMAQERDATHLVCVLWPDSERSKWTPLLIETMANVAPLPKAHKEHGQSYLPLSLRPLFTQEEFTFKVYKDVIRVFLFYRGMRRYVETLVLHPSGRGIGAPFVEILNGSIPRERLLPVFMNRKNADATDLSGELEYPLGMRIDPTALRLSEVRADACVAAFTEKNYTHVFLLSTETRSLEALVGKRDDRKSVEEFIRAYVDKEVHKAEAASQSGSYKINGLIPMTPFYILPGLYAHFVGLRFPSNQSPVPRVMMSPPTRTTASVKSQLRL